MKNYRHENNAIRIISNVFFLSFVAFYAAFFIIPISHADASVVTIPAPVVASAIADNQTPAHVKVGVYVLNVGKLDTATGAFTVDFYLSFSSDRPVNPGNFEFANGRSTSIDKSVDEPTEKFYRIQASLADNLDLGRYPFDSHELTIEIEDKEQTVNSLVYEVSRADSGLDPSVNIVGWVMDDWDAKVVPHYYQPYDTTFSKYVFSLKIHRSPTAAIFKTFLPAIIIVWMGLLSILLTPDKIVPRLTLTAGALTGAVMFHLNMTSSLPPLGYITFGDRFMLINYVTIGLALISTLVALTAVDRKQDKKAKRVHDITLIVVPVTWLVLQAANFLFL
jgi:hypothetical protein